ncbi:putative spermidine/putrescine transport system ATP-binding protein [Aneurinibacillus soli]|uniref:Carnitine transport ATP-binding protein OpuCA n=1 Tax=Aneurinibacillus soli TaxID=1500254 RepID=A0A0U5AVY4_9BACL|nr:ABC transporter ATP-binding protein [Aneurinibacillus soli]PYE58166.1 putative spermidine/putrescine transport system ATP-binding protein [Aneurinibacillus soli]BAU27882.1 Spermidine/putrescine import ATP-binding protein PotA [Aneurinibacillus soli]
MSYVSIDQVTKRYENQVVLNNISLTLQKGEFATLLGQSGCGKSTLLRSIAGLEEVDVGSILVDQKNITHLSPRQREVGMVFQSYALFPNMTVFDNIAYGLKMKKETNIKPRVQNMIDMVDLTGKEGSYPHQLSGGQQQRVALARALVMEPKVLLLDEPLSALDAKIRKNLQKELKRIQRELEITTIFVTHDQEEAMTLSDKIFIMNEGNIVQYGSPSEIYTSPINTFVAKFIGNYNVLNIEVFNKLVCSTELTGHEVAIRPEVLQLIPDGQDIQSLQDNWTVQGFIRDISMTGNVLRYEVETDGSIFYVDSLHHQGGMLEQGSRAHILIPKKECIAL